MGAALPQGSCAARAMLFVGGPSTEGAGKVVDKELSEPIRSHEVPCHSRRRPSWGYPILMRSFCVPSLPYIASLQALISRGELHMRPWWDGSCNVHAMEPACGPQV